MGNYIPARIPPRLTSKRPVAPALTGTPGTPRTTDHERIARERERHAQIEAAKHERMAARREQRAKDACRADARRSLEAKAGILFPWDLMAPDRKIAALLTSLPPGTLFPIFELARLFAG